MIGFGRDGVDATSPEDIPMSGDRIVMESMSVTRRVRLQLAGRETDELIALRNRLLAEDPRRLDFLELVEEELRKRPGVTL